ncbi:response regulator transcription factor [Knoellia locipacati]|uniref:response regulator transcription factor n=1 Tax=Knoellia locipacati TaxID=882824 RepID=UPI00385001BA
MPLVLVVDDDATVAGVVRAYLERAGFETSYAGDGPAAVAAASAVVPAAVVLDLMLPGMDGIEVCRQLRQRTPGLPVVMLTARGQEEDRILGLEVGADDYVTKPFSPRELVLRVQSVLRRATAPTGPATTGDATAAVTAGVGDGPGILVDGDLRLDQVAHRVELAGAELTLTAREFDLLAWFLKHPGEAFRRERLMTEVWGWDFGDPSTVTVHVRRLREKVERTPSMPSRLVTVFGVGYRWDPQP